MHLLREVGLVVLHRGAELLVARREDAHREQPGVRALPTATVATGTPPGICTIDSSESSPSSWASGTGTPITGSGVIDAVMPGRCAAPPAPAMITRRPRSAAERAYSVMTSGVRCAETMRTSWGTPKSVSTSIAACITGRSESLPMITPTSGGLPMRAMGSRSLWGSTLSG